MMNTGFSGSSPKHDPVSKLIFELAKLPGVGEKTATRLTYFILKQDATYAASLAEALISAKQKVGLCAVCFTFTDTDPCRICMDSSRDRAMLCVIERPSDLNSIEMSGTYRGAYHVLHGALSPLDGIGPDELKIRELMDRLRAPVAPIREVLLAMNPSVEGDATSLYLTRLIRPLGIRVTQLAHGIPMGGQLEYTDRQTIGKAIENRMEMR